MLRDTIWKIALFGGSFALLIGAVNWLVVDTPQAMSRATAEPEIRAMAVEDPAHTAMFGAGCFWHVEQTFRNVPGVTETAVGYTGGSLDHPTYHQVGTDRTGHCEAVLVKFDPNVVTYDELLNVFWNLHDPTQVNRQGPDIGYQYRSAAFYFTPEQEAAIHRSMEAEQANHSRKIATAVEPARTFWRAEEYHQRYYEKKGSQTLLSQ